MVTGAGILLIGVGVLAVSLVLLIGVGLLGRRARTRLAAKYPPPGRMVDVGGYAMHIVCQGEGSPTVVLESPHGDFSPVWALVQPQVAGFTRVCSYDRAGLGWSERNPQPRTIQNMMAELHTLLARAGVEPPYVLVGHSIGGLYARFYAHEYPDQVAGMVLVDARHEDQDARLPVIVQTNQKKGLQQLAGMMRLFQALNSIGLLALFFRGVKKAWPAQVPPEAKDAYLSVACSDTRYFQTMIEETAAIEENCTQVRAAQITTLGDIPLVVLSAPDQFAAIKNYLSAEDLEQLQAGADELSAKLAALSPRGSRVAVRESGHYIEVDQPQAVIDAIRQVVETVRG